jgi:hypothetical protein
MLSRYIVKCTEAKRYPYIEATKGSDNPGEECGSAWICWNLNRSLPSPLTFSLFHYLSTLLQERSSSVRYGISHQQIRPQATVPQPLQVVTLYDSLSGPRGRT